MIGPIESGVSTPHQVLHLLQDLPCPWGVAGGWAVDLFLDRITREHQDIEVAIFRADQSILQDYLGLCGWSFEYVREGRFYPWLKNEFVAPPVHEIWGRTDDGPLQHLEVLLNERTPDKFIFRRDPRIQTPIERGFIRSDSGIPILAPDIVLLYKSKRATEHKEQLDFSNLLGALDRERRQWLLESLETIAPEHEWLAALRDVRHTQ